MIYLLRHAETEWNFEMRKQGLDDSPLTERGRQQASGYGLLLDRLIGEGGVAVEDIRVDVSPLGRTRATAGYLVDMLGIHEGQVRIEDRLIEFDYGEWSGLTNEEIETSYPGFLASREENKWHYQVPGGQSYADVEAKVDSWLGEIADSDVVIAVTHSVVSRVIRGKYSGLDYQEASRLEHLQDCIYRLEHGRAEQFEIDNAAVKATAAIS